MKESHYEGFVNRVLRTDQLYRRIDMIPEERKQTCRIWDSERVACILSLFWRRKICTRRVLLALYAISCTIDWLCSYTLVQTMLQVSANINVAVSRKWGRQELSSTNAAKLLHALYVTRDYLTSLWVHHKSCTKSILVNLWDEWSFKIASMWTECGEDPSGIHLWRLFVCANAVDTRTSEVSSLFSGGIV